MKTTRIYWKTISLALICSALLFSACIPPPAGQIFSFAVIADPHVTSGSPDTTQKMQACVDWINAHYDDADKGIAMVFVVGDMGGSQGTLAKAVLDDLVIPYVPLIGDNDVHWSGTAPGEGGYFTGGLEFEETFGGVYDDLASVLENWQKAPTPVWNPEIGVESYLHNASFDYEGVHFVCLDWCTRKNNPTPEDLLQDEQADLHDFAGGTWPWFTDDIAGCVKDGGENIVMLTHHPMHVAPIIGGLPVNLGAFDHTELARIEAFTAGYGSNVYANIAGHYHIDLFEPRPDGEYDIYMTRAVHDDFPGRLKLVRVYGDGSVPYTYHHEYVQLRVAGDSQELP
jgi:hypothetical protein